MEERRDGEEGEKSGGGFAPPRLISGGGWEVGGGGMEEGGVREEGGGLKEEGGG